MTTTLRKNQMSILNSRGDTKIEWNPDSETEWKQAEKQFKDYRNKHFRAFRVYDDGKKGEELTVFDRFAAKVILVPPIGGG